MKDSATKVGASIEGTALRRLRAVRLRPTIARIGVLQVLEAPAPKLLDVETVFRDLIARGVRLSHGEATVQHLAQKAARARSG